MKQIAKIKMIAVSIILLAFSIFLPGEMVQASEFSVEADPATFVFKGYAAHLFYRPDFWANLKIGLGTYKLDLPDFFINIDSKNANQNWTAKIMAGAALFLEYDLSGHRNTYFSGLEVAAQNYRIESSGASSDFTNFISMFYFGYRWFPREHHGFYLKPWAGIGYQERSSGNNCIGSSCYDISPLVEFATIHLGYAF